MHYYQFNIGDYASHTSRLSIYEDIAYRRLLDLYYLTERPLNGCLKDVAREIGMMDSLSDVEYVLKKFFIEDGGMWRNNRCDLEIKAYQNKRESASKAGKASAKARQSKGSEQSSNDSETDVDENSTDVQPNNNHKPITNNQEQEQEQKKKKATKKFVKPSVDEINTYCRERKNSINAEQFFAHYESNGWKVGKNPMKNWKAAVITWEKRSQNNGQSQQGNRNRTEQFNSELDRLAKEAIDKGETL